MASVPTVPLRMYITKSAILRRVSATRKMAAERYGDNTSPMIGTFESIRKCLTDVKTRHLVNHMSVKEKNCFVELKDELKSCL